VAIAADLARDMASLEFETPSHVYNPLDYIWSAHRQYLQLVGDSPGRLLLLGMNPGPWGMAQTGVPFGEISMVRDWMGIQAELTLPLPEQHNKYPIDGFSCARSEPSGRRFWGWFEQRFGTAARCFDRLLVWNYCPLLFIGKNRNLVPGKLTQAEREPLLVACDGALTAPVEALRPAAIIGIGRFAESRARQVVGDTLPVDYLLHPSPANPAANKHWAQRAETTLGP